MCDLRKNVKLSTGYNVVMRVLPLCASLADKFKYRLPARGFRQWVSAHLGTHASLAMRSKFIAVGAQRR